MNREIFEKLVAAAVDSLPEEFKERLENVDVVVENHPSRFQLSRSDIKRGFILLGLYEGVPLTERTTSYGLVPPDKITIFQQSIESIYPDASESRIKEQIRKTVIHEIAHHFGISDERLEEIEREKGKKD
jgi:predicted Zn-dependent protease with MMP-like domain